MLLFNVIYYTIIIQNLTVTVYIYIYVCVCVCVCLCKLILFIVSYLYPITVILGKTCLSITIILIGAFITMFVEIGTHKNNLILGTDQLVYI